MELFPHQVKALEDTEGQNKVAYYFKNPTVLTVGVRQYLRHGGV